MVPCLLEGVLKYGPLVCVGYIRGYYKGFRFQGGPILMDHVTTLRLSVSTGPGYGALFQAMPEIYIYIYIYIYMLFYLFIYG